MTKVLLSHLPNEIQNNIYMFNCEHKPQMKIVLEELMRLKFPEKTNKDRHKTIMKKAEFELKFTVAFQIFIILLYFLFRSLLKLLEKFTN
jgi:hypothetical protein